MFESRIHERTISLKFLGIILRVLILEGSVYNDYIINQVTVKSKEENSLRLLSQLRPRILPQDINCLRNFQWTESSEVQLPSFLVQNNYFYTFALKRPSTKVGKTDNNVFQTLNEFRFPSDTCT